MRKILNLSLPPFIIYSMVYFPDEATKVVLVLRKRERDSKVKGMVTGNFCKRNLSLGGRGATYWHISVMCCLIVTLKITEV